jgi:importin-7
MRQCESYLRLAGENVAQEEAQMNGTEMQSDRSDEEEDKTYAAMGVAKTLSTVCGLS